MCAEWPGLHGCDISAVHTQIMSVQQHCDGKQTSLKTKIIPVRLVLKQQDVI